MPLTILIVGAGIAGLSLALSLQSRSEHRVILLEKSQHKSHEIGYAISLAPNGSRVLQSIVPSTFFRKARFDNCSGVDVRDGGTLHSLIPAIHDYSQQENQFGARMKTVCRSDWHIEMTNLVEERGGMIRTGVEVRSWDGAEEGRIVLESGEEIHADLIVAADGVRSEAARYMLGGEEYPELRFSGTVVFRFTIPTQIMEDDEELRCLLDAGIGMMTYHPLPPKRERWIVRYYCRENTMCSFALYSLNPEDAVARVWEKGRMEADREQVTRIMEGFHPALRKAAGMARDVFPMWRCMTREPLPRYHRGQMVVIGDAAHPLVPNLGLGSVTALEDAGALGVIFEDVPDLGIEDVKKMVAERLEIFSRLRVMRVGGLIYFSDVPFFRDAFEEQKDQVAKWLDLEAADAPKNMRQVLAWYMKYDVISDARRALKDSIER